MKKYVYVVTTLNKSILFCADSFEAALNFANRYGDPDYPEKAIREKFVKDREVTIKLIGTLYHENDDEFSSPVYGTFVKIKEYELRSMPNE